MIKNREVPVDILDPRVEYHAILHLSTLDWFVVEVDDGCQAFLKDVLVTAKDFQLPFYPTLAGMSMMMINDDDQ